MSSERSSSPGLGYVSRVMMAASWRGDDPAGVWRGRRAQVVHWPSSPPGREAEELGLPQVRPPGEMSGDGVLTITQTCPGLGVELPVNGGEAFGQKMEDGGEQAQHRPYPEPSRDRLGSLELTPHPGQCRGEGAGALQGCTA